MCFGSHIRDNTVHHYRKGMVAEGEAAGHIASTAGEQRRHKRWEADICLKAHPIPVTQHRRHSSEAQNRPWVLLLEASSFGHHCPKGTCSVGHLLEPGSVMVGVSIFVINCAPLRKQLVGE